MKTRVNLTIENEVLINAKRYASQVEESLSELVEDYLKKLAKKSGSQSLIDYVDKLDVPKINAEIDFKKTYHENNSAKYGS
jgi:hypothetical protein